ncbi:hypothetical protein RJT34_06320 [Clitoria ternatea]|uniref:Transmembrane protein n=1 Tax=Clitoria ternatea TaxID=43366 RepID=A0AAN9K406_CLITE
MASPIKFTLFSACVLVFFVVVAAQYGGGDASDMPKDMPMGPAPHTSASPRSYPAIITILLPFMLTFLGAKHIRI